MNKNIFYKIIKNLKDEKVAIYSETDYTYRNIYDHYIKYKKLLKIYKVNKNSCIAIKLNFGLDYISIILASYTNKNKILIINPRTNYSEDKIKIYDTKSLLLFTELKKNNSIKISNNLFLNKYNFKNKTIFQDDDFIILYTSGTTKKPKGVLLSEKNISNNIISIIDNLNLDKTYSTIIFSNPSYAMGLSQIFTFLYLKAPFSISKYGLMFPRQILDKIQKYKTKIVNINSSMAKILIKNDIEKKSFKFVKIVMHGGMPLDKAVYKYFKFKFPNAKIINFYGCTENSPRISHYEMKNYMPNCVGIPLRGVKIKIHNKIYLKNGNIRGELAVSGNSLSRGYLKLDSLNKKKFINKFFYTGDYVEINKKKEIFLIGRIDNTFRVGHEKLEPEEIENFLNKIDGIAESFVTKTKDKILNWKPIYFIKRSNKNLTKKTVYSIASRLLESFKLPKNIFFVNRLYKTNYGKLDRSKNEEKLINN